MTQVHEFDCTGCGLNTATLDPSLIRCDDCRVAYARGDAPFPTVGDFCETCVLTCDHCETELAAQHMHRVRPGVVACPDCIDLYGKREDDGPDEDEVNERMARAWADWRAEA